MLTITPYVYYEDVASAVDWLSRAFGFQETVRLSDSRGSVTYAELTFGPERLMVARFSKGFHSPRRTGYVNALVYITVDDVQAHFAQARLAMAKIIHEPEDKPYGLREYMAEDPEGQRWIFAEQVRDLLPEEWGGVQVDGRPALL